MGKGAGKGQGKGQDNTAWHDGFPFAQAKGAAWPWRNVYNMANANPKGDGQKRSVSGDFSGGKLKPTHGLADYVAVQPGSLPKIRIAILCWQYTVDIEGAPKGYDWSLDGWVMQIVLRDLFLMIAVAGIWDYILYFSPLKDRLRPYKFNSKYPPLSQIKRDAFWTFSATLLASAQEVLLMRWWAGGNFKAALFGTPPEGETSVPWDTPFFGTADTAVFTCASVPFLCASRG